MNVHAQACVRVLASRGRWRQQESEVRTRTVHLGFGFVNVEIRGPRIITPAAARHVLRDRFPSVRLSLRQQAWVVTVPGLGTQQSYSFSWAVGSPNPHGTREDAFRALLAFLEAVLTGVST